MDKIITKAEFRAKLKDYLDELENGKVLNVSGLKISKYVQKDVHNEKDVQVVHNKNDSVVHKDVQIDYVRLSELIAANLREDKVVQNNISNKDFDKKEVFENLKSKLDVRNNPTPIIETQKEDEYVEVDAYSLGDITFGYAEKWIKMKREDVVSRKIPKIFVREIVEEVEGPKYDLDLTLKKKATSFNDGSNSIDKSVKGAKGFQKMNKKKVETDLEVKKNNHACSLCGVMEVSLMKGKWNLDIEPNPPREYILCRECAEREYVPFKPNI
jgi:hypothetical protein